MAKKESLALFIVCAITYCAAREPSVDYIDNPWREGHGVGGSRGRACFWGGKVFQDGEGWRCNYFDEFDPKIEQCNTCFCQLGVKSGTTIKCPPMTSKCPSGWVTINQGCYKFYPGKSTWNNADKKCKTFGGRLASKIEKDLPALIKYARQYQKDHSWWIGMSDISQEGKWVWTDGTTGISKDNPLWASGQPNNLKGREDCAILWNQRDMLLGDTTCYYDVAWDGKFEFRPLCQYVANQKG